jgi:preprotein translocase subunit YajC
MMSIDSLFLSTFQIAFQAPAGMRDWGTLLLPVSILLIFYVLVWMPARKRQKETQAMLGAMKRGDKVVTTGGLYGEIVSVDGPTVILRIADTVKVKVARSAIATLEGEGDKGDKQ